MPQTPAKDIKTGMTLVLNQGLCTMLADAQVKDGRVRLVYQNTTTGGVGEMTVFPGTVYLAHSRKPHRVAVSRAARGWVHACQDCTIHAASFASAQGAVDASRKLHWCTNDTVDPTVHGGPGFVVRERGE